MPDDRQTIAEVAKLLIGLADNLKSAAEVMKEHQVYVLALDAYLEAQPEWNVYLQLKEKYRTDPSSPPGMPRPDRKTSARGSSSDLRGEVEAMKREWEEHARTREALLALHAALRTFERTNPIATRRRRHPYWW